MLRRAAATSELVPVLNEMKLVPGQQLATKTTQADSARVDQREFDVDERADRRNVARVVHALAFARAQNWNCGQFWRAIWVVVLWNIHAVSTQQWRAHCALGRAALSHEPERTGRVGRLRIPYRVFRSSSCGEVGL